MVQNEEVKNVSGRNQHICKPKDPQIFVQDLIFQYITTW